MTINLSIPQTMQELRPRITVVGVGGAGCNAVNNMISADLDGVDFLVANTDGQALAHSLASRKIQLGSALTQGLGAGSKPEIGRAAAEESLDDMMAELADSNMVFITAGMGGGTGTGAAPVIARAARERGILTVGVITKPFEFEGQRRMTQAEEGIEELQAHVDTLIIIPNQNLFRLANERTTFADAFHMADTVLHQGVCGVTDLMIKPGMINLDFADIRAVMGEMGKAMMGTGEASGDTRAIDAAEAAINNPLLDDTSMKGAHAVLINVTGGMDMTLFEVDEAANRIRKEVDPDAIIIFGSAFDEKLEGIMRVSVVATGIDTQTGVMPRPARVTQSLVATPPRTSTIITPINKVVAADETEAPAPSVDETQTDIIEAVAAATETQPIESGDTSDIAATPLDKPVADLAETAAATGSVDMPETAGTAKPQAIDDGEKIDQTASAPNTASDDAQDIMSRPLVADKSDDLILPTPHPKQTSFIPPAASKVPNDVAVPPTTKAATPRPSLINKISGLWSAKPEAAPAKPANAEQTEAQADTQKTDVPTPDMPKMEKTSSILDLPRVDMVQHGAPELSTTPAPKATAPAAPTSMPTQPTQPTLDGSGDDLDIPAFLRRQAN
jgi:cell division protein FtsZ